MQSMHLSFHSQQLTVALPDSGILEAEAEAQEIEQRAVGTSKSGGGIRAFPWICSTSPKRFGHDCWGNNQAASFPHSFIPTQFLLNLK
jgi:hypothetical protein